MAKTTRRRQRIAGTRCALCLKERELQRSHIIPEFFYKALALYDDKDKHRFYTYSTDPDDPMVPHQKGFREHLLCEECEGRFNQWETYSSKVLFGGVVLDCSEDAQGNAFAKGVDYLKFKLFAMSLLWRAGVSSLEHFSDVTLGVHQERLRERLLAADPGRYWEYGISILYPPDKEAANILSRAMGPPEPLRFKKSHRVYRLMLGMTFWLFPVSNHMSELERDEWRFSLFEDGRLIFHNGGAPAVAYVYRFAWELQRADAARSARE